MGLRILFILLLISPCYADSYVDQIQDSRGWHRVHASREGLVGRRMANGERVGKDDIFVALPHVEALGRTVVVIYEDQIVICEVKDVGPHSIRDDYWDRGRRPLSEKGKRLPKHWGRAKNKAGIDLSDGLWKSFGISRKVGLVQVSWKFLNIDDEEVANNDQRRNRTDN